MLSITGFESGPWPLPKLCVSQFRLAGFRSLFGGPHEHRNPSACKRWLNLVNVHSCISRQSHANALQISCPAGHQKKSRSSVHLHALEPAIASPPDITMSSLTRRQLHLQQDSNPTSARTINCGMQESGHTHSLRSHSRQASWSIVIS